MLYKLFLSSIRVATALLVAGLVDTWADCLHPPACIQISFKGCG